MKNIHIIPTDKPSRLRYNLSNVLVLTKELYRDYSKQVNQNIYITSDEEIKEGDWFMIFTNKKPVAPTKAGLFDSDCKKIILTTNGDLIKDGVQKIDDEFIEWFVKNPSCERVEIEQPFNPSSIVYGINTNPYKIIIPKEEPKQEIIKSEKDAEVFFNEILNSSEPNDKLKKAAEEYSSISFSGRQDLYDGFIEGAKFQAERMYSEEEVYQLLYDLSAQVLNNKISTPKLLEKWFEQFKKK